MDKEYLRPLAHATRNRYEVTPVSIDPTNLKMSAIMVQSSERGRNPDIDLGYPQVEDASAQSGDSDRPGRSQVFDSPYIAIGRQDSPITTKSTEGYGGSLEHTADREDKVAIKSEDPPNHLIIPILSQKMKS